MYTPKVGIDYVEIKFDQIKELTNVEFSENKISEYRYLWGKKLTMVQDLKLTMLWSKSWTNLEMKD